MQTVIERENDENDKRYTSGRIKSFLRPVDPVTTEAQAYRILQDTLREEIPVKSLQSVSEVIYNCAMELPILQIATPMFYSLVDMFHTRVSFTSKVSVKPYCIPTHRCDCRILRSAVISERLENHP